MDIVKAFNSNDLHTEIVIKGTNEEPMFRASDIGQILDISSIRSVIRDFDSSEKGVVTTDTLGGTQDVTFLTEKGLYKVLFKSRKPIAEKFQNWVCDVIKEIRLRGKYELETQLECAKNEIILKEESHKVNLVKEREQILLREFGSSGSIVYIIKVKSYDNGEYIVKIGESRIGITNRFAEHKSKYEEVLLLDCFAVNRSKDFESFLHNHENIRSNQVTNLEGHTNERELFLIGKHLTYQMILKIIKNNLKYFDGQNLEQLKLETEKLKLMVGFNGSDAGALLTELLTTNKLLLDKITGLERSVQALSNQRTYGSPPPSISRTVTGFNTPLVTLGPRLQKVNPETMQLVQVYETVSECMKENNRIKRPSLNKAVAENTVYEGFRWLLVERDQDATILTSIEKTTPTIHRNSGYIAKLNADRTEILSVYLDRKTASINNGYDSTSALDIPVKNLKISRGHYYMLYYTCEDTLKIEFERKYGTPILYKDGVGQYDKDNKLIREFACKYDCIKILRISDKTLTKALDKEKLYEQHYYKYIGSKLQIPFTPH